MFNFRFSQIPFIGKYKTYIAAGALMAAGAGGLFHALGDLLTLVGSLVTNDMNLADFATQASAAIDQAFLFFNGLGLLGIRHGIDKATGHAQS